MINKQQALDLTTEVALAFGLLALGIGTGLHMALKVMSGAILSGSQAPLAIQAAPKTLEALRALQSAANVSLYVAAGLLIGGGLLANRKQVSESVQGFVDWSEQVGDTEGDSQ